jgi:hypothetical protein
MKITEQDILAFFDKCKAGTTIPGVLSGNNFNLIGLKKYSGKGAYSYLSGTDAIVLESGKRRCKNNLITLFPEPLVILST